MPKMRGTGKDPLGRYPKGLIFDMEDNNPEMVQDFAQKGWAEVLPDTEHPGRTPTQIAQAMLRGDSLTDPVERAMARELDGREHAVVHLEDGSATEADYQAEAQKGPAQYQDEPNKRYQIPATALGGIPHDEGDFRDRDGDSGPRDVGVDVARGGKGPDSARADAAAEVEKAKTAGNPKDAKSGGKGD